MTFKIADLKSAVWQHVQNLAAQGDVTQAFAENAGVFACQPINEIEGHDAIAAMFQALHRALPDLERRDHIFVAGDNLPDDRVTTARPEQLVATMGVYQGTFAARLFDIPPTHGTISLRFCEAYELDAQNGKIQNAWIMWDMADLMIQAGVWPLARSLGAEGQWCSPLPQNGLRVCMDSPGGAMAQVLAMHNALGEFDGVDLDSMPHADYWTDVFMWYGPGGIGSTRGLAGFRAHHQIPFLHAFPDRKGAGHYMRIEDGPFAVTAGWPSVTATHTGEWLGIGPTGNTIKMRVMDFYRLDDNGMIAENWVPIDVIDIALQMGVDVFARMRHHQGQHPTHL